MKHSTVPLPTKYEELFSLKEECYNFKIKLQSKLDQLDQRIDTQRVRLAFDKGESSLTNYALAEQLELQLPKKSKMRHRFKMPDRQPTSSSHKGSESIKTLNIFVSTSANGDSYNDTSVTIVSDFNNSINDNDNDNDSSSLPIDHVIELGSLSSSPLTKMQQENDHQEVQCKTSYEHIHNVYDKQTDNGESQKVEKSDIEHFNGKSLK